MPGVGLVLADEAPEVVEQRKISRLRDLMRALTRALKAKKMYPANNPVLARILSEFQDTMMGTLDDLGELTLAVQQADLLYNSASIYNNAAKRDSLAYRFHRDGITEIVFASGLTPPELNAFLDVLARATEPQGAEEDLVTLLWEQEFSHIRYAYLAIDDLQESLLQGVELPASDVAEDLKHMSWPGAGECDAGLDLIIDPGLDVEGGSGERSDDWNELTPALDITERCPAHLLELSPAELQELAEEIHLEHSRPLTEAALEILTEVAEGERNVERFTDLARALADLVIIALADADLTRATQVLATLRTLAAERGVDAAGYLPDAVDLVRQTVASVHHFAETDTSSLPEFVAHLGAVAIDPVCDLLDDAGEEALHPQLAAGLSLLATQDVARVGDRLTCAKNPAAGHILAALAALPGPEVEPALARAIEHPEPRVRRDALQALLARRAAGRPEFRERVARALEDPDPQVRSVALAVAREHAGEEMAANLLGIVEAPGFRERSAAEKRSFFETLARVPHAFLKKTLREWAAHHLWWPDAAAAERRALAAWALARTGDPDDRAYLARHAQSIFPGVRKACARALAEAPDPGIHRPRDGRDAPRRAA
jgi:HEAT repeat protein